MMDGFWIAHAAARAAHEASQSNRGNAGQTALTELNYLKKEVAQLSLTCHAMWQLMKDKLGATDEELMAYIAEIDLADGKPDGQNKAKVRQCRHCGRNNARRHDYCMYCGESIRDTPFD